MVFRRVTLICTNFVSKPRKYQQPGCLTAIVSCLNRSNDANGMIDNLPTSIDYAGIGIKLNDQFSLFAGKQCAAYGGIEFDLNPIDIYQYSDMIDYMSNFMTG